MTRGSSYQVVVRWVVILCLLGAAVIHAGQISVHLEEWLPAGITFVFLAMAQFGLAVAFSMSRSQRLDVSVVVVSLAAIWLWGVSRTVGIPFGPDAGRSEPVARADVVATIFEGVIVLALFMWRPEEGAVRSRSPIVRVAVVGLGIAAGMLTWYALQDGDTCSHDLSESPTGPLIPIDAHSILPRNTPEVEAALGDRFGLVVGKLWNCGRAPLTLRRVDG